MTIYCKLCNCAITNIGPYPGDAMQQCMEVMARHLVERHNPQARELKEDVGALVMLLTPYLMVTRYVRVPPNETELLAIIDQGATALMNLFAAETKPVA